MAQSVTLPILRLHRVTTDSIPLVWAKTRRGGYSDRRDNNRFATAILAKPTGETAARTNQCLKHGLQYTKTNPNLNVPPCRLKWLVEGEKTNGRWAMMAVAGILGQELLGVDTKW